MDTQPIVPQVGGKVKWTDAPRPLPAGQTLMDNNHSFRIESVGPLGLTGVNNGLPGPTGPGYQKFRPVGPVQLRLPGPSRRPPALKARRAGLT